MNELVPTLPILSWQGITLGRNTAPPSLLDAPALRFTTSGRAAIWHALRLIGLRPGERVLMPSYHCMSMVTPAALLGGEVEFYPIGPDGGADLEYLGAATRKPVRAILAAHFFGLARPMVGIRRLCDERGIALIEDCAHALWGHRDGHFVGAIGDYAVGSMTKFFPVLEGGCIASSRHPLDAIALKPSSAVRELKAAVDILQRATRFRRLPGLNVPLELLWRAKSLVRRKRPVRSTFAIDGIPADRVSLAELDTVQAGLGMSRTAIQVAQHTRMNRLYNNRRDRYLELQATTSGLAGARPLESGLPDGASPYVFPLWADDPDTAFRDLREAGIAVFRWDWRWPSLDVDDLGVASTWAHHVLQLPCHQDLSNADMDLLKETVARVFRR